MLRQNKDRGRMLRRVGIGLAILALAVAVLGILPLFGAHAGSDTATVNVNVSDGITIRVLDSTATTDLEELTFDFTPTDAGVSQTKDAAIEVATSNATGYKLYMQSDWREDNTSSTGVNVDTDSTAAFTTSLVHSLAPAVSDVIPSAVSSSGDFWYYYNGYYDENRVIPAFSHPELLTDYGEATEADLTRVPLTVGVDTAVAAGTYRNKLVFTAVANELPVEYNLEFDLGGGYEVTAGDFETMTETVVATSDNFVVPDVNPGRAGYKFKGWLDMDDGETVYQKGETVTLYAGNVRLSTEQVVVKRLKAVWTEMTFFKISTMQEMTPEVCDSVYTPSNVTGSAVKLVSSLAEYTATDDGTANVPQYTLRDIRDGNEYVVRKLADGNCWMVENLRLGDGTQSYALTPIDSDVSSNFILPIGYTAPTTDFYSLTEPKLRVAAYINYGNYYNWTAATAGSISDGAIHSICPLGWSLPSDYGFVSLKIAYGNSADFDGVWKTLPINLAYSGLANWADGILSGQENGVEETDGLTSGYLYSSSYDTTNATAGYFGYGVNSGVAPGISRTTPAYGLSIRCIAR